MQCIAKVLPLISGVVLQENMGFSMEITSRHLDNNNTQPAFTVYTTRLNNSTKSVWFLLDIIIEYVALHQVYQTFQSNEDRWELVFVISSLKYYKDVYESYNSWQEIVWRAESSLKYYKHVYMSYNSWQEIGQKIWTTMRRRERRIYLCNRYVCMEAIHNIKY